MQPQLTFWFVPFAVDKVTEVLVVLGHPCVCYSSRLRGWTILQIFKELRNTLEDATFKGGGTSRFQHTHVASTGKQILWAAYFLGCCYDPLFSSVSA